MKKYIGKVMTVKGPIDPSELGATLTHEHLFLPMTNVTASPADTPEARNIFEGPLTADKMYYAAHTHYGVRENCNIGLMPGDFELIAKELENFKKYGGKSVVALQGTGVDDLLRFADVTGLHIITSTGYLRGAAKSPTFESRTAEYAEKASIDELYDSFMSDIEFGYQKRGVLPGIIGELHTGFVLAEREIKILRAAARAHKESGLPISIHLTHTERYSHDILDILEAEGVDLNRVILGHIAICLAAQKDLDFHDAIDYMSSLAARGAYLEFDLCGNEGAFVRPEISWAMPSDRERAKAIFKLCLRGYSNRILTCQDTGHRHYLTSYGGWGYGHVLSTFKKTLQEAGLREDQIHKFNYENPAKVLTIV